MSASKPFTFEISLSVLDHLGRNLYRSFTTVLGEAISNAWDAEAENVWIYFDRESNNFVIKDDGNGMSNDDFQKKFLKIGYSKRKAGVSESETMHRPFIGRKGIGKLALLSCASRMSVISKTEGGDYVGGTIDNSGLDQAIVDDLSPNEYPLEGIDPTAFKAFTKDHKKGTIIYFENLKDGIRNSQKFLKKTIALYFRFSLIDDSFNIFINDELITLDDLNDLAQKTEFLWTINGFQDPFIDEKFTKLKERDNLEVEANIKGFIASVEIPTNLKILSTDERVTVDLFVNGRIREKAILKHIPTARLVESYLYGQIHFDELDDDIDRFTSSREGIVADDPVYKGFLEVFNKKILTKVLRSWDAWRRKHRETGDEEDKSITPRERKSGELYNVVAKDYKQTKDSPEKEKVDDWIDELAKDAPFNFSSYADCYISENLIRKYIESKKIALSPEAIKEIKKWKKNEVEFKKKGNISIDIRKDNSDLSYLSMDDLANLVDKKDKNTKASLSRDAREYKPMRNALSHTALLTDLAKTKLTTVYENIRGRVKTLLSGGD